MGLASIHYNKSNNSVELVIADKGITIYGSYVAAQKHLDKLGNSDAEALNLAPAYHVGLSVSFVKESGRYA